jgi:hypothetical protein
LALRTQIWTTLPTLAKTKEGKYQFETRGVKAAISTEEQGPTTSQVQKKST